MLEKLKFWPIAKRLSGSSAIVFGRKVFGRNSTKFILTAHKYFYKIYRAKLWFLYRFHPRYQNHIIRTGLEPGYYDEDVLILHACMKMLERYIKWYGGPEELEKFNKDLRGDPVEWTADMSNAQADRQSEAVAIYKWWTVERPADEAKVEELMDRLYGKKEGKVDDYNELRHLQDKIFQDEQKMLHRLIDIRPSLWT